MKILITLISAMLPLIFVTDVLADSQAIKRSYTVDIPHRPYVFVMLGDESSLRLLLEDEKSNELLLRTRFKASGLYEVNSPEEPLWTVDWYAQKVFVSSDLIHLVRLGDWASKGTDEAFSFFEKGRIMKSYMIQDLVDFFWLLPHSVSHFLWEREISMNYQRNELIVSTRLFDEFVFDIATGQMIRSFRSSRAIYCGLLFVALGLFFVAAKRLKAAQRVQESTTT